MRKWTYEELEAARDAADEHLRRIERNMRGAERRLFVSGYVGGIYWADSFAYREDGELVTLHETRRQGSVRMSWDAIKTLVRDAREFYAEQRQALEDAAADRAIRASSPQDPWQHLGYLFALNRNGHGAGYWDAGLPYDLAMHLSRAAKVHGDRSLILSDEGILEVFG